MEMEDLVTRLGELQDLNQAPLPTTFPATDEELKAKYLELLAEGENPASAARMLGKTGRYMRSFRSERSERYDEDFRERFEEIMRPGGENQEAIILNARAALVKAAEEGNVRAIEKILMAWDPDFEFLRPAAFQSNTWNVEKMVQVLPGIPTEVLLQMREALAAGNMPEIEQ